MCLGTYFIFNASLQSMPPVCIIVDLLLCIYLSCVEVLMAQPNIIVLFVYKRIRGQKMRNNWLQKRSVTLNDYMFSISIIWHLLINNTCKEKINVFLPKTKE